MENKKTIFLLEDDESFTIILKRWLEGNGSYNIVAAKSIEEARDMLSRIDPPHLFWLDYYLNDEVETGLDFLREIQANPRFAGIPIIIVSITVDVKKLEEFKKEGATQVFSKTLSNRDEILSALKKLLGD